MGSSRRSFFLISTLVFGGLALLFFGLYQREVEKDLLPSGTEVIGKIVQVQLDVARRPNARLLWSQLDGNAILYRKDTIRTGPGSRVLVKLNNDSSVALGENTLVVLETENESLSLRLADGDVEFSGNVTVSLDGNTKLRAVDGTLRLKRDSNTGKDKVAAVSGKAEVLSGSTVTVVEQGEVLMKGQEGAFKVSEETLESAGLSDLGVSEIDALATQNQELRAGLSDLSPSGKVFQQGSQSKLRLTWKAPRAASRYLVKIGTQEISVLEPHLDVVPQDMLANLDSSISVQAIGTGAEGEPQKIELERTTRDLVLALGSVPQNQAPFSGSRVLVNKKTIKLYWSDLELKHKDFLHYNVMVQNAKGRTQTFKSKVSSLDLELDQTGTVAWSVEAVFKGFGAGQRSEVTKFEVIGGATLSAPAIKPASEED